MEESTEEHGPSRPAVNEVELLVAVPWAEEEGDDGVLGCE